MPPSRYLFQPQQSYDTQISFIILYYIFQNVFSNSRFYELACRIYEAGLIEASGRSSRHVVMKHVLFFPHDKEQLEMTTTGQ
jgi:hypothetical protein